MAATLATLPEGSRITDYVSPGAITKTFPLEPRPVPDPPRSPAMTPPARSTRGGFTAGRPASAQKIHARRPGAHGSQNLGLDRTSAAAAGQARDHARRGVTRRWF